MARRYLFGPVSGDFANDHLRQQRQAGDCLAFDLAGTADLSIRPHDTWEDVCQRLPDGKPPDFIALYLPYNTIPDCLWHAPIPIIGLAADWNLLWHGYRPILPVCDLVLADASGVDAMRCAGICHVRQAMLFGWGEAFAAPEIQHTPRDIDVLFVGNFNPAVQRERLAWLGRLAKLSDRYRVVLRSGVFGDEYRKLLQRARIVFNRSIRGEANKRTFEAATAGALLFQEAGNREVGEFFRDRQECVLYTDQNLETLLEHFLENEGERQAITTAAHARAQQYSFELQWQKTLEEIIEPEWNLLIDRARSRSSLDRLQSLRSRSWSVLSGPIDADPALEADLASALIENPQDGAIHNALGLLAGRRHGPFAAETVAAAAGHFQRAIDAEPAHLVAGLNLAECLAMLGQREPAVNQARRTLALLERTPRLNPAMWDSGHFPPAFDCFCVEWERAAWENAGNLPGEECAKRQLLRWRLHFLLAELTGDLNHFYEAALARPDLPLTRAMLGCALARAGRMEAAIPHLRQAVSDNPFDLTATRALGQALDEVRDNRGHRRLARQRWLLSQTAAELVPVEPWFTEAVPADDDLASILILCCNQLEFTRLCIESVLRHTRQPYELIVVDNGSTDGTAEYLHDLGHQQGPARIEVIRNEENRGYPAGCNQALAKARGQFLVFLNNDTIVTAGWLDSLISCSLHDWPTVGMVGAVTNYSRPPQQIAVDYADVKDLPKFARRRRQEFAGKAIPVERLTGFCLLIRRDVLKQIGGYDEQFGLGFFDDDDLSVRALRAGYRLAVALDVFIHHFGSRTFTGLGIDCTKQLQDNFQRFREKWGEQESAGYRSPAPPSMAIGEMMPQPARSQAVAEATTQPRISLCMIVKNEEANLFDCLHGLNDLFDEIIVVDTGSSDRTKEIAQRLEAKVFDFPWVDSFAAARNESLKHATGDWVFWLDGDDRLDDANRQKLRALFRDLPTGEMVAYSMKCVCLPDPVNNTVTVVDHIRLFPNHPQVRWHYRVHEQILPAIRRLGGQVRWSDVVIQHTGYQDPALRGRKLQRDLRLLHLEDQEHPDDPFTLFNLGSVYQEMGKIAEAIPLLRRSLQRSQPTDSIVRKLYALIAQSHRHLQQHREALATCQEGRRYYPDDAELIFQESLIRREVGDLAGAESCLLRLLNGQEGAHFASVDAGLRGYKARHNLAVVYQEQGRLAEAEAQWQAVLAEQPGYPSALLGLGEVFLATQRWQELEAMANRLEQSSASMEAAVLRSRLSLARKDFALARQLLEEVIASHPQAIWPRRILSHVLLQEGKDWAAAERALQDVLTMDPDNREARNNLSVLLQQQKASD